MKRKVLTAFLAMILMVLSTLTLNCAAPSSSDPDDPAKPDPGPGPGEMSVALKYTIPQDEWAAMNAGLVPGNPTKGISDEWNYDDDSTADLGNINPAAITPGPSPTYVGIGGFAVKEAACTDLKHSPYSPGCLRDVTSYCPGGICNVPLNVSKADDLDIYFFYGGVVHPENITVVLNSTNYQLDKFASMMSNPSLLAGDSAQRQWVTACFRIDQNTSGIPSLSTANPFCTYTQNQLWVAEVAITGVSFAASVTDPYSPYDGTQVHDGDILIRGTVLPQTLVLPATDDFPRILWGGTLYSHVIGIFASNMGGTLAAYSSSRSPTAPPGDISPLLGGVFIRTKRVGSTTYTCNISNPLAELHHITAIGTVTQGGSGRVVPMLYYNFAGFNATTGCVTQGATNVLQYIGGL